jgi:hypothetical protein
VSSLSDEPPWEPARRFKKAGLKSNFTEESLWVMKIGETRSLLQKHSFESKSINTAFADPANKQTDKQTNKK